MSFQHIMMSVRLKAVTIPHSSQEFLSTLDILTVDPMKGEGKKRLEQKQEVEIQFAQLGRRVS